MDPSELLTSFLWILNHQKLNWIKQRCGQFLTAVLLRPDGLRATLYPILNQTSGMEVWCFGLMVLSNHKSLYPRSTSHFYCTKANR